MIYLFCLEKVRKIEESKHSLPAALTVLVLDDDYTLQERQVYDFDQPQQSEIYSGDIDGIVLDKWRPVLEDALCDLGEDARLIFLSERDARLFSLMKNKFRMRTGAVGTYSLQAMTELADQEENKGEFRLLKEELKEKYTAEAEEWKRQNRDGTMELEERIRRTGCRYGMKVQLKSGTAYVTTYAGEWYFAYNDRPITLYHSNAVPVRDAAGHLTKYSHVQPVELYSPLHALAYIKNHEAAEERRLMRSGKGKRKKSKAKSSR